MTIGAAYLDTAAVLARTTPQFTRQAAIQPDYFAGMINRAPPNARIVRTMRCG